MAPKAKDPDKAAKRKVHQDKMNALHAEIEAAETRGDEATSKAKAKEWAAEKAKRDSI